MPSLEENKFWDTQYSWIQDGDEWSNLAAHCKKPYEEWKNSIAKHFIVENINQDSNILEISPGHGRWTKFLLDKYNNLILVDLSPKCIEFCEREFSDFENVQCYANDGKTLDFIKSNSIDFIWSFDSFVHMEKDVITSYFKEFSRVLKKGGIAIIHHSGRKNIALPFKFLKKFGKYGKKAYQVMTMDRIHGDDGWRADISKDLIKRIAEKNDLHVEYQINSWGKNNEYHIKLFNDFISKMVKQ